MTIDPNNERSPLGDVDILDGGPSEDDSPLLGPKNDNSASKETKRSKESKKFSMPSLKKVQLSNKFKIPLYALGFVAIIGSVSYYSGTYEMVVDMLNDSPKKRSSKSFESLTNSRQPALVNQEKSTPTDTVPHSSGNQPNYQQGTEVPTPSSTMDRNASLEQQLFSRLQTIEERQENFALTQSTYDQQFKYNSERVQELSKQLSQMEGQLNQLSQAIRNTNNQDNGLQRTVIQNETNLSSLKDEVKDLNKIFQANAIDSSKSLAIIESKIEGVSEKVIATKETTTENTKKIEELVRKIDQTDYRYKEAESVVFNDGVSITKPKSGTSDKIMTEYYFDGELADGYRLISTSDGAGYQAYLNSQFDNVRYGKILDYVEGESLADSYLLTTGGYRIIGRDALNKAMQNGLD